MSHACMQLSVDQASNVCHPVTAATLTSKCVICLQIFGEQISYGSPYDRPEVMDFPTYAACRFLDTSPNNPVSLPSSCRLTALCMQLVLA